MLINIIIMNILWNIQFTTSIPLENTHNDQFITFTPIAVNQYRKNSVHSIITDDHISKILEKLGLSTITFTTKSSPI
ncbi:unnamed protein product [Rotaria sordida]|nr:unnamed protein product [Rotaria sordida]